MEQSRLISLIIAKLKIAYPYYFKDLTNEEFACLFSLYQEELSGYNENTLIAAIRSIIRENRFMPTIKDIIDECEKCKIYKQNIVIERMIADRYFGNANEIDKAYKFIEEDIIPEWLLIDMKKYGYIDEISQLNNKKINYLNLKEDK